MAFMGIGALCPTVWGWGGVADTDAQYVIHAVIGTLEKTAYNVQRAFSHLLHHLNLKKKKSTNQFL